MTPTYHFSGCNRSRSPTSDSENTGPPLSINTAPADLVRVSAFISGVTVFMRLLGSSKLKKMQPHVVLTESLFSVCTSHHFPRCRTLPSLPLYSLFVFLLEDLHASSTASVTLGHQPARSPTHSDRHRTIRKVPARPRRETCCTAAPQEETAPASSSSSPADYEYFWIRRRGR